MATRFYLPSTGSPVVSPNFNSWDNTARAERRPMSPTKLGSLMTTKSDSNMDATSDQYFLSLQYTSEALAAQTFAAGVTLQVVIRAREELTSDNASLWVVWKIVSGDLATTRAGSVSADDATELATSLTGRSWSSSVPAGGCTASAGDYMVIEIGYDISSTPSDADFAISYGDAAATDLSGDGDIDADNPWFEISQDVVFESTGVPNQLMLTGVGT